jgi:hypothetical protein
MKKGLLILLCLPMIGFGQDYKLDEMLVRKLQPAIEEYYIQLALQEGYKLTIKDSQLLCECLYKDGDWINNKTNDYCQHELGRTYLYFSDSYKIQVKDINNDGINDYIINYSIEGVGGGNAHVNYYGTILGGERLKYVKTENSIY